MSLEKKYYGDNRKYNDPYCYKNSEVLINYLDIKDKKALEAYERAYVSQRLLIIYNSTHNGDFSLRHYLNLHKFLFEDVYPFAGKTRNVDIMKGDTYFARYQFIEKSMKQILDDMREELPQVKTKEEYSRKLAEFYLDLNLAHPFREGNGRCQREFLREYVEHLNPVLPFETLQLDYSKMNKGLFLKGTIEYDVSLLSSEFNKALIAKTKQKIAGEEDELKQIK